MTEKFNLKKFIGLVAAIALPVALQNLLSTTGSMVDTMMISSVGKTHVAAVGQCTQFASLLFSSYWGFVGGGMLFFGQYWGAKDEHGLVRSYGIMLCCMMFMGFLFSTAALVFPGVVMDIYTDKADIRHIGIEYLSIVGFAYPMQVLSIGMSSLLRTTDRVRIPLYAAIASVCTNLFFNWVFIFGNLGAPEMGVRGAAVATTIAAFVNMTLIMLLAKASGYNYLFMISGFFKWDKEFIKLFLKKCFPIIVNELLAGVGNLIIAVVFGRQSQDAQAAMAVFRTFEGLVIGFFAGFSNAASVLVGTCVGAGEIEVAYQRAKRLVFLCQGCIFTVAAIMLAVHSPLLHWMNLDGDSYYYGTGMLIIYGISAVIRMGNWTMNDSYRSAGDATTGTVMEIAFMYVVVIPAVCISGLLLKAPVLVIFLCCYIDEPIRYIFMQRHMYSGKWIRPVTPEGLNGLEKWKAGR
ncbi:MAG: MATE family efflux transporter [Lachnospiraceae bacterium]|nr:MATE family efflux transporter [Lachnospiraceae bacterium]